MLKITRDGDQDGDPGYDMFWDGAIEPRLSHIHTSYYTKLFSRVGASNFKPMTTTQLTQAKAQLWGLISIFMAGPNRMQDSMWRLYPALCLVQT